MSEYMFMSAMHFAVVQVIKTGILKRLGKTTCNSRTQKYTSS